MSTVFALKENNARGALEGAITNVATSLVLESGQGARFPATGNFYLAIWNRAAFADPVDDSSAEIVLCTARSTDTLTITRAQEGTSGVAHADGEAVMLTFTKAQATEYETAINERLPNADGTTYDTDDEKVAYTAIGGIAVRLTNKTSSNSVAGELVDADTSTNDAVKQSDADSDDCIGAFLDDGVADGSEAWVVVGGICDVMLKDATAATRGNWVKTSDTAGRADATAGSPPGAVAGHFQELGHCIETISSGTDVKARILLHFN